MDRHGAENLFFRREGFTPKVGPRWLRWVAFVACCETQFALFGACLRDGQRECFGAIVRFDAMKETTLAHTYAYLAVRLSGDHGRHEQCRDR